MDIVNLNYIDPKTKINGIYGLFLSHGQFLSFFRDDLLSTIERNTKAMKEQIQEMGEKWKTFPEGDESYEAKAFRFAIDQDIGQLDFGLQEADTAKEIVRDRSVYLLDPFNQELIESDLTEQMHHQKDYLKEISFIPVEGGMLVGLLVTLEVGSYLSSKQILRSVSEETIEKVKKLLRNIGVIRPIVSSLKELSTFAVRKAPMDDGKVPDEVLEYIKVAPFEPKDLDFYICNATDFS